MTIHFYSEPHPLKPGRKSSQLIGGNLHWFLFPGEFNVDEVGILPFCTESRSRVSLGLSTS